MSRTLKELVKQRVRDLHNENVALSANDPKIESGLRFHGGWLAPLTVRTDIGRVARRKLERQTMKQLASGK